VFVCNLDKAKQMLGWQPQIAVREGVKNLSGWVAGNKELFAWLK
jgi:nucleoside-diphosphate-sugar epimerase